MYCYSLLCAWLHFRPHRYFSPKRGANYCDDYVCLFVCMSFHLSVCLLAYLKNQMAKIHVGYGYGSILLWQLCDMLRTSGFVDDVTVPHSWLYGASCVFLSDESITIKTTASVITKFSSTIKISSTHCWLSMEGKYTIHDRIALFVL